MDFIVGLLELQEKDCIFVVVDWLTKYVHFHAIFSKYRAPQVVDLFFREISKSHGLPKNIFSDRDSRFLSLFWQELFKLART